MSAADSYELLVKAFPILNAGALTALIAMILRHRIATRKVRIDEEISDRKGWGELIQTLTEQVERLSKQVTTLQTENALLRNEIGQLHNMIDGMRRGNLADSLSDQVTVARSLNPSPQVSRALDTLEGLAPERKTG